jgi:dTMP kinase
VSRARLITLEGGEGTGKSTQAKLLAGTLQDAGIEVVLTREPGGAPGAEQIRTLLVDGEPGRWDGLTETLLHFASRREHLARTVLPALERGAWVVSDRFADSTMAYQGYGHGLDRGLIENLYGAVVGDFRPDLTIVLDMPAEQGLARAGEREAGATRYERMGLDFHRRLRDGFLEIARGDGARCAVIDAAAGIDDVHAAIMAVVRERLAPLGVKISGRGEG